MLYTVATARYLTCSQLFNQPKLFQSHEVSLGSHWYH